MKFNRSPCGQAVVPCPRSWTTTQKQWLNSTERRAVFNKMSPFRPRAVVTMEGITVSLFISLGSAPLGLSLSTTELYYLSIAGHDFLCAVPKCHWQWTHCPHCRTLGNRSKVPAHYQYITLSDSLLAPLMFNIHSFDSCQINGAGVGLQGILLADGKREIWCAHVIKGDFCKTLHPSYRQREREGIRRTKRGQSAIIIDSLQLRSRNLHKWVTTQRSSGTNLLQPSDARSWC